MNIKDKGFNLKLEELLKDLGVDEDTKDLYKVKIVIAVLELFDELEDEKSNVIDSFKTMLKSMIDIYRATE